MKTPHASLLAVISLSLALCACDKGDKPEASGAPSVPPKKPKADAPAKPDTATNPQPPEPGDAPKSMSAPAAPGNPAELGEGADAEKQLQMLNMAVGKFGQKQAQKMMMNAKGGRPTSGSGSAGGLKSLDQLVTEGLLKKIPDAPEGKKFMLDPKTGKVTLENK